MSKDEKHTNCTHELGEMCMSYKKGECMCLSPRFEDDNDCAFFKTKETHQEQIKKLKIGKYQTFLEHCNKFDRENRRF